MPFAERVEVMQSDRKLVHLQGNYFSAVSLDGLGPGVDAFLFEEEPRVDETVVLPARTINPVLQDGGFHAIRYDLYADSQVLVEWSFTTSRFGPSVLFLRGDEAFSMFKNGDLQDVPYSDKLHEKYHSLNGQFLLKARSRSQYYFIFYAKPGTSSGEATFHVTAKTLNLKYPAPVASSVRDCPDKSKSCTLNLHSNGGYSHQPDYFLALVTPTTSEYGDLFSIRVGKSARVMKYVGSIFRTVLFIIVFGGFIASVWDWLKATVLVCVGVVLCGCRRLREGDYSPLRTDDEESAIGGQSQSLQQPPGPVQAQENAYPTEAPPAYTVTSDPEVLMGVDVQAVKQQNQNQPQQSVPGTSSSGRI
ncbi:hypothetical protein BCR33DRAFT_739496 [Rhizoclosmatium globosum]|uniref:Uncharacterized protein n=1 Tax=Rhizoclosmatium globosum TaxID=329046 RepID=A0A1Y2C4M1_9FUNG|nr:hypothetical protein BCR33DRAFT_739496 [Rhizoclosmatium globosum]|eukprot:ORY41990.1 hypothetical protein BCR33DRAFT_739496 [Rhizoclosmatium globosum]